MNDQHGTAGTLPRWPSPAEPARGDVGRGHAPFGAQLLGMDGVRRGLRGGQTVLRAARGAYLQTQWSGHADRRLSAGLLERRKV